jgi:hypothetical protein
MIKNVYWSSCEMPFIPVQFSRNLSFLDRFSKTAQKIKFHESQSSGAELFQADGRTDR